MQNRRYGHAGRILRSQLSPERVSYSLDAIYTLQDGRAKGTMFKLHFTQYDNHSDIPSYAGGYGNIFQDERDVKFMVIAPFTIF
jgi:hypothetical protein